MWCPPQSCGALDTGLILEAFVMPIPDMPDTMWRLLWGCLWVVIVMLNPPAWGALRSRREKYCRGAKGPLRIQLLRAGYIGKDTSIRVMMPRHWSSENGTGGNPG